MPIRVLVVSQYPLIDQGLRAALAAKPDIEVIGVCRESEAIYAQARSLAPDVLLVVNGGEELLEGVFPVLEDIVAHLVCLNITADELQVYHRQSIAPSSMSALIDAIVSAKEDPYAAAA